ncbi:DUF4139 domain-containing protein [Phaeovulum sp.]|uniref:DUF4139 domain-containing protein n=1 Tax=Phaeovulum sp. TaxID=2934796 RepID=UPI0039E628C9
MPRLGLCLALAMSTAPAALFAETIEANSKVTQVTLYPWGATVTRRVAFSAPEGAHELIVADLPMATTADTLRVSGDGVTIGAVSLIHGRLPVTDDTPRPAIKAAKEEVKRLEEVLRGKDAAIAAIRLRADAANEQVAFLRGLNQSDAPASAEDLRALSRMVADEVLAASQRALTAGQEADTASRAREGDVTALDKARQALAALTDGAQNHAALSLMVQSREGGGAVEVTSYTDTASWRPVYDMRLDRAAGRLDMERGVVVSQSSGEDWRGVDLVLSTARPSERSEPSALWPWLRRIDDPAPLAELAPSPLARASKSMDYAGAAPVLMETAGVEMMGATVTYHYATPVDIRDGVEDLRLKLDDVALTPTIIAEAVPAEDSVAYLVAEGTNDSGQVLLPGQAVLFLDGALVGGAALGLTATGDKMRLGFGPIDGLRLTRTVPQRSEGGRGVISKSNELQEVALLKVENLTDEDWPLRVLDRVPYSEQDDLKIRYTATPAPSEIDRNGARGVLAWESDIKAGATQQIRLETTLTWPEGKVLN